MERPPEWRHGFNHEFVKTDSDVKEVMPRPTEGNLRFVVIAATV